MACLAASLFAFGPNRKRRGNAMHRDVRMSRAVFFLIGNDVLEAFLVFASIHRCTVSEDVSIFDISNRRIFLSV